MYQQQEVTEGDPGPTFEQGRGAACFAVSPAKGRTLLPSLPSQERPLPLLSYLYPSFPSSTASCLNSSYIFLLKWSRRKKDQNRKSVFISWD